MKACTVSRKRAPYGLGESMCDRELQAWLDELETIAPPCIAGNGRTDGHGAFVSGPDSVCAFCRRPIDGRRPHWDYSHLLAAFDFAEPWTIARAS